MLALLDAITRETIVFASVGLLVGGIDDLLVDLIFVVRLLLYRGNGTRTLADLPPGGGGTIVVFVPAWDESRVIGGMLRAALARFDHAEFRIYVGLYPNDRGTIDAAATVAERDDRVTLVIGPRDGPTTKADCLNALWRALARDEAAGLAVRAVVFHDAEDVVHPAELRVFDALIDEHAVVQLPVQPLVKRGARLVSGHYADEFSEAHLKQMVVRTAVGAGMPLAGTGCAIAPAMLRRLAEARGGDPFDPASLVEDYELGLTIADAGGRACFARVRDAAGDIVAVRAYFPDTLHAAVRQKARWMTGIALAGWDRTGWSRPLAIADHWMRMRDRRAPLSIVVLAAAYVALVAWSIAGFVHWVVADDAAILSATWWPLLVANAAILAWRIVVRAAVTAHVYDPREAWWSVPRLVVGNYVALLAARRAGWRYLMMLRGEALVWDKTRHDFPDLDGPAAGGNATTR